MAKKKVNKKNNYNYYLYDNNLYPFGGLLVGALASEAASMAAHQGMGLLNKGINKVSGHINKDYVNSIKDQINALNNTTVDANDNNSIMDQYANQNFNINVDRSKVGSNGLFNNTASHLYNELVNNGLEATNRAYNTYNNAIDNVNTQMGLNALMNSFANGGKIHIKKANRGKFTEAANRANMGVQEYASHILANKERYSPTLVKRANFARNASKWYDLGGPLFTHGSYFPNGINEINNGGTHENNINGGVPQGVDNQGNPNLVEEGEVVWNDYVFSNRLKLNDDIKNMFNLRGKDLTFADAVKQIKKESEERPNDPISKRGLEDSMNKLMILQEGIRQKENKGNTFAQGGHKFPYIDMHKSYATPVFNMEETGNLFKPNIREFKPIEEQIGPNSRNIDRRNNFNIGDLRYAPIVGSALSYAQNLINKPDYSRADTLIDAATKNNNFTPIKYKPIGNYLTYNPFDTEYYSNQLGAQAGATRRAIENTSGGNRANALAGILASDYNSTNQLGDLYRKANEYNQAQKERIEGFNRGTNQANSEMDLKTNMYNSEMEAKNKSMGLDYLMRGLAMKDAIDNARNTSMSANLTNLFDNLGNVGIDYLNRMDKDKLADSGVFGILNEIMKDNNYYHNKYDNKKACGGKLKRKKG